jgi:hypothetical protein
METNIGSNSMLYNREKRERRLIEVARASFT